MIRPVTSADTARSQLVRYDFSNGVPQPNAKVEIYSTYNPAWPVSLTDADSAIERVLNPSGFWRSEDGSVRFVSVSAGSTLEGAASLR
jgi:hypothetical protein